MAQLRLTKNELRLQQHKLLQLEKYLPTLQLKKAMLQLEINQVKIEIKQFREKYDTLYNQISDYSLLFSQHFDIDPTKLAKVQKINLTYENIAGVEVPIFEKVLFEEVNYSLFDTPSWLEIAKKGLRSLMIIQSKIKVLQLKLRALQKECRQVAIRVNLFEKVMIPRAYENIKKIKIFLGDQQLAAVCQAKVAKSIIISKKKRVYCEN